MAKPMQIEEPKITILDVRICSCDFDLFSGEYRIKPCRIPFYYRGKTS